MEIKANEIKIVDIDSLIPNPKNNNKHSAEQIERLTKLIKYQGFRNPVVVSNRTGFLVVGHGRIEAARKAGLKEVPVIYQDFDTEAQEYAYLTSDNEIARWAEFDKDQFDIDLKDLGLDEDFDLELFGLPELDIPVEVLDPQSDEDAVPELKPDPIAKRGDIWILGNHRLMCGDSTMIDDVEKLMDGHKADMVFTDPPYGIALDTDYSKIKASNGFTGAVYNKVIGDDEKFDPSLILSMFSCASEIFIFGADYFFDRIECRDEGSLVVWDKRSRSDSEVGNFDNFIGSDFEICFSKKKHQRKMCRVLRQQGAGRKKEDKAVHPTQKPIELIEWFFERWCDKLSLCVDLFLGSGSTLIACEKTNRKCFGMELSEQYVDVIIKRYQDYTGKDAILETSGETYNSMVPQDTLAEK
tara:strand:- start:2963 stop:4198 length:1236 start_codon:yes stop_codon:yes gene_type:complete